MKYKNIKLKGQSLFEVVLSLAIISIIIVALVYLSSDSVSNTTFSKTKTEASKKAQEAIEWLRSQRDADWDDFTSKVAPPGKYCLDDLDWNNAGVCAVDDYLPNSILVRDLTLSTTAANRITAEVVVSWKDSDGTHQTRVVTDFTNWR